MRIGINLLCILPNVNGGVETYALSMVNALIEQDRQNEYVIFVNRQGARLKLKEASNVKLEVCDFDARSRELRYAWEQIRLPLQFYRLRIDVAHSVGYQGPIFCPCPSVVTIPDLNFIACGDTMGFRRRAALRFFSTRSARRATRIITISYFSEAQIVQYLAMPANRIRMIHLGPGLQPEPESWDVVRAKHGIDCPYIVAFAGNNHPHKNLPALFAAFRQVHNRGGTRLAIIGRLTPDLQALAKSILGKFFDLGFVPDDHIGPILSHAQLCVIPSLYEGFGLPVLEAQTAGVPLACSNAASLSEVAGEGAYYFDPRSIDDMSSAIDHCLSDPTLCRRLVDAGRENLKRFSWERTAAETLAIYEEAVRRPNLTVDIYLPDSKPVATQVLPAAEKYPADPTAVRGVDSFDADSRAAMGALMRFCRLLALSWCVFFVLHTALPYIRSGADVIYKAKVEMLAQRLDADTIIFGNSKVLSGFLPRTFDAARGKGHSFNLGLPAEERFITNLETLASQGQPPREVLLTVTLSAVEHKIDAFHYLERDRMTMDQLFPFRHFPRDLTLFLLRSHTRGGPWIYYRQNQLIVSRMVADRGYYFIEGQSRYPRHQLPSDFRLASDQPTVVRLRPKLKTADLDRLRSIANRFQMQIWFVPQYYREGEYAVPPATNPDLAEMVRDEPRLHLAGPDYWVLPVEYFSDGEHLSPKGAEIYTRRLADLLANTLR